MKAGEAMARLGLQVEAVEWLVAQQDLDLIPGDALGNHAIGDTQPVPDFQRALGLADRAAADAHRVVLVEHDDRECP